jgi:hypothetical protein
MSFDRGDQKAGERGDVRLLLVGYFLNFETQSLWTLDRLLQLLIDLIVSEIS